MVNKKDEIAQQMISFLSKNLEGSETYKIWQPKKEKGGHNHFLISEDLSTAIMLLNQNYTEKEFKSWMNRMQSSKYNKNIFLPVKDGKNYFRSAAFTDKSGLQSINYKQNKDLSLKNYSVDELKRAIFLSKPEQLIKNRSRNEIIYYQPESKKLEELLVKHKFSPVIYDYSHISSNERFGPETKESKTIYLWKPESKQEVKSNIYFGH
jgi:hypothetical protein